MRQTAPRTSAAAYRAIARVSSRHRRLLLASASVGIRRGSRVPGVLRQDRALRSSRHDVDSRESPSPRSPCPRIARARRSVRPDVQLLEAGGASPSDPPVADPVRRSRAARGSRRHGCSAGRRSSAATRSSDGPPSSRRPPSRQPGRASRESSGGRWRSCRSRAPTGLPSAARTAASARRRQRRRRAAILVRGFGRAPSRRAPLRMGRRTLRISASLPGGSWARSERSSCPSPWGGRTASWSPRIAPPCFARRARVVASAARRSFSSIAAKSWSDRISPARAMSARCPRALSRGRVRHRRA